MSLRKPIRRMAPARAPRGFTLIEITVVLVIMALLLAGGLALTTSLIDAQRVKTTRQNLEAVRESIQAFVARNGRFPCPAVETLAPSANGYGVEAATPGTCTSTTNIGSGPPYPAYRGVVPWKTLGMQAEVAFDGWNNQVTYVVARTATNLNASNVMGVRGTLLVHNAVPVAAGLQPTGNQINACSTTAGDNACNAASVVVLVSHGRNILGAFNPSGVRAPLPTSNLEVENTDTTVSFVNTDSVTGAADSYDDVVLALSPNDVLGKLYAQGVFPSEQALLKERFKDVAQALMAYAIQNRTGSTPGSRQYPIPYPTGSVAYTFATYPGFNTFFANCPDNPPNQVGSLPTTPFNMQNIKDPWGSSFRYEYAENNDMFAGEDCQTPIVIVSLGPDLTLGTGDDIVHLVPLGELQAAFSATGW